VSELSSHAVRSSSRSEVLLCPSGELNPSIIAELLWAHGSELPRVERVPPANWTANNAQKMKLAFRS